MDHGHFPQYIMISIKYRRVERVQNALERRGTRVKIKDILV